MSASDLTSGIEGVEGRGKGKTARHGQEPEEEGHTAETLPNIPPMNPPPPDDLLGFFRSHSSIAARFDSSSFFAYSIGISFPSYAFKIGRTSGVLKIAIAINQLNAMRGTWEWTYILGMGSNQSIPVLRPFLPMV